MLSYDPCKTCIEPTWEMYLDPSKKYIGPPGTPGTFRCSICAIGRVTRLDKEPRISIRIVIWISPPAAFFAKRMLVGLNWTPLVQCILCRTGQYFDQRHNFQELNLLNQSIIFFRADRIPHLGSGLEYDQIFELEDKLKLVIERL